MLEEWAIGANDDPERIVNVAVEMYIYEMKERNKIFCAALDRAEKHGWEINASGELKTELDEMRKNYNENNEETDEDYFAGGHNED